jgi:hypothetical protein
VDDDPFDDDQAGEVRAVSAHVLYDGNIAVMLAVPGHDEPAEMTFPGDLHTLFMTSEESKPIDLDGTKGDDRYCQEIVARGVARLNADLAQRRAFQERRRREQAERAEHEQYV